MKKTIFLILFCAGAIAVSAQQYKRPPNVVMRSYQKEYRVYNNPTWDMQNNQWHTRWLDKENGNRNVDVYYDKDGRRIQTGREWDPLRLPAPVRERISNRYHEENYSAYRLERPGKIPFYQITLAANKKVVYINEKGREVRYY